MATFRNSKSLVSFYLQLLIAMWTVSYTTLATMMKDLQILDALLKKGYDRRATPTNHLNNSVPTHVFCELFVRSFGSPNPLTMDYKVDLYLRQAWKDERLMMPNSSKPLDLNDPNLVKAIWKPEIYFPNAKEADFQYVTVPNVLVRINPNGDILYMLRLRVTFSCMMDLSKFPLDKQTCQMEIASFSKTVEELVLDWKLDNPVTTGNLGMSQFSLDEIVTDRCQESFQIGNYSCLVAEFLLSRSGYSPFSHAYAYSLCALGPLRLSSIGFHLVQSYLPTILMVVISWVSFWMDVNSVPGRVTLGVTTLLTVSSKATNIQENLPQASYVKAIDVWMGSCTAFVFLALLEFTVVNYLWRKECCRNFRRARAYSPEARDTSDGQVNDKTTSACNTLVKINPKKDDGSITNHLEAHFVQGAAPVTTTVIESRDTIPIEGINRLDSMLSKRSSFSWQTQARNIDEICRYAFPLAFMCFNLMYWNFYLFYR